MFEYTFSNQSGLLRTVSICFMANRPRKDNFAITFYLNKADEHDSPELDPITDKFNLRNLQSVDDGHDLQHPAGFPGLSVDLSHAHYTCRVGKWNLYDVFYKMVSFTMQFQENTRCRQSHKAKKETEFRAVAGDDYDDDEVFGSIIENYDTAKPFLPPEEKITILKKFNHYQLRYLLQSYVGRVASHTHGGNINFAHGFWFFKESRAKNREINYRLAQELIQKLTEEYSSNGPDTVVSPICFRNILDTRRGLFQEKNASNKINSRELNKIISIGMKART